MFYLTTHSSHSIKLILRGIYGEETRCHHFKGYSFRLAARDLLYDRPTQYIPPLLHQL